MTPQPSTDSTRRILATAEVTEKHLATGLRNRLHVLVPLVVRKFDHGDGLDVLTREVELSSDAVQAVVVRFHTPSAFVGSLC